MSDSTPIQASVRKHLGELADAFLGAKVKLVQKLQDRIAGANTSEELALLRKELAECLISKDDVVLWGEAANQLATIAEDFAPRWAAVMNIVRHGRDPLATNHPK